MIRAALERTGARVELVALAPWSAIRDDAEYARLLRERVRDAQASMYVSGLDGPAYPRAPLLVEALNATPPAGTDLSVTVASLYPFVRYQGIPTPGAMLTELRGQVAREENSGRVGFVSLSTNDLTRNALRVFANDALLPGLRLLLGYSDQTKTKAPHTATTWATFLGGRHDVSTGDGRRILPNGRLDPACTSGIL